MLDELVMDLQGELDIGDAQSENRGRGGLVGKTSIGDPREIAPPVCQARYASFWATSMGGEPAARWSLRSRIRRRFP